MRSIALSFLVFSLLFTGCSKEPSLPEVKGVEEQELTLWKAGASVYLPNEFQLYKERISKAKASLREERNKFFWSRDYESVREAFLKILKHGEEVSRALEIEKERRASLLLSTMNLLSNRMDRLRRLTLSMNEGLIFRALLTKADVSLLQAQALFREGKFFDAEEKLGLVRHYIDDGERAVDSILHRFRDRTQIETWRKWAREAIEESRRRISVLVVKIERRLILYKDGKPLRTFQIGLGRRGLSDKFSARDDATPEGRYKIIGKNPRSNYFKALLINYPNHEDLRAFQKAKKSGLLPKTATIGGLIEIHGGGSDSITQGCISLDNHEMADLYELVDIGTPVTIVGALN